MHGHGGFRQARVFRGAAGQALHFPVQLRIGLIAGKHQESEAAMVRLGRGRMRQEACRHTPAWPGSTSARSGRRSPELAALQPLGQNLSSQRNMARN